MEGSGAVPGVSVHWAVERVELREAEQAVHVFVEATAGTAFTEGPSMLLRRSATASDFERPGGPSSLSCVPESRSWVD